MSKDKQNIFDVMTANERLRYASQLPDEPNLFDVLWTDNEVCILFARPGLGKSILAVQAAEVIASGSEIGSFTSGVAPDRVGYLDFELGHKQFEKRYGGYSFSDNLIFITPDEDSEANFKSLQDFERARLEEIKRHVSYYGLKRIVIDNLTWINSESEKGNVSGKFMQEIKAFQKKNRVAVLVIAHTPKIPNNQIISITDLYGSSMLANYTDSMFAIGESVIDDETKYIKQIKTRSAKSEYNMHEVLTVKIKSEGGMLFFEKHARDHEWFHLKSQQEAQKTSNIRKAIELKDAGKSNIDIAAKLSVSERTVRTYLKDGNADF